MRRLTQYKNDLTVKAYSDWQTIWKSKEDTEKLRSNTCCSICLDDYEAKTKVRETPCFHYFHDECLMTWIARSIQNPDCPYCKHMLKNEFKLPSETMNVEASPAAQNLRAV